MEHLPGWPHEVPAFHAGEAEAQRRAGVGLRMAEVGARVMRAEMPAQHRELFERLPFLVVGALDAEGRPWASAVAGAPGFVRTPDAQTLAIGAQPVGADALGLRLAAGDALAVLGLEPATRRRNRANGRLVAPAAAGGLAMRIDQSFGNCPKYIHAHALTPVEPAPGVARRFGAELPPPARALLARADTVYLATASPAAGEPAAAENEGLDVSHRGGPAGFVVRSGGADRKGADGEGDVLTLPDYPGNLFFNTVGNVLRRPQAGLLAIDRVYGDLLLLTTRATVDWTGAAEGGAERPRALRLAVEAGLWLPGAWPLREALAG